MILEMGVDITIRKKMELALKKSEEDLRLLTSQVFSAQENERKRVAMELHEGLAQSMTILKLYLRSIQRHLPDTAGSITEDFDTVQKLARAIIDDIRRISQGLSPVLLEILGLEAAIKHLMDELGKYQDIKVNLDIDSINYLFSPQIEINLFRVIQESLHNITKHSQATQISVAIKRQNGRVDFSIRDNGVGFDVQRISRNKQIDKGMGLAAMDERLRMIGSQFNIVSQPGEGTEISFSIPVDAK